MKRLILLFAFLALGTLAAPAREPGHPGGFGISFGVFYSSLDSYGEWISVTGGMYAWRPHRVARSWRPYFYGHWSWTADGWYWVSDEPWAWAVYHYGRWYYDDYYGWIWVPGYDWAPAWVEWRYSGDVIGWAPLGPYAVFDLRYGVSYHRRWVTPYHYWSFVGIRHFGHRGIYRHVYRERENRRLIGLTRSTGEIRHDRDRIVNRGPDRAMIEERTGRRLREADIIQVRERRDQRIVRGTDRDEIRAYRPRDDERSGGVEQERPARVRESGRRPGLDLQNSDVEYRSRTMGDRGQTPERERKPEGEVRRPEQRIDPPRQGEEPQVRVPREQRVPPPEMEGRRVPRGVEQPKIERREAPRMPEQPRIERQREVPRERRAPEARPAERPRNEGRSMERPTPERERRSEGGRERGRR